MPELLDIFNFWLDLLNGSFEPSTEIHLTVGSVETEQSIEIHLNIGLVRQATFWSALPIFKSGIVSPSNCHRLSQFWAGVKPLCRPRNLQLLVMAGEITIRLRVISRFKEASLVVFPSIPRVDQLPKQVFKSLWRTTKSSYDNVS